MACPPEKLLAALQRQASGSEDVPVQMDRQASSDEKGCIRDEQDSPGAQEPDSDGARLPPPGWGGSPTGLLNQQGQESAGLPAARPQPTHFSPGSPFSLNELISFSR